MLDTRAARGLGCAPVTTYEETVTAIREDSIQAARRGDWRAAFPVLARYGYEPFDYRAEDAHRSFS